MNDLLAIALKAHGGMERWRQVSAIQVKGSITGAIWAVKSRPDVLKDVVFLVDTQRERVTMDFPDQSKHTVFEPERVVVRLAPGARSDIREEPEQAFEGHTQETPWNDIHVAYFSGEALWTYLNTPFLYTWPGFETEEIASITVEGETWRRLLVTFPDDIKSHTRSQISCFGPDGLLRRHDYTVDVLGGARGLNYAYDYRNVDGIIIPTTRRVYGYEGDYQPIWQPVLVEIDMRDISLL